MNDFIKKLAAVVALPSWMNAGVLAYDRDITCFDDELLSLFRKRVAYAFVNVADAGLVQGFITIFDRLGIGYVELLERRPSIDLDVILVRVADSQILDNTQLMLQIIRQYGRICRRYQFEVMTCEALSIRAGWDQDELITYPVTLGLTGNSAAIFNTKV